MKYFNFGVEGIRGIAIVLVILFHTNIIYFNNCFIGVDLTFLLSGYLLMKSYLFSSKEYSYSMFYLKRFYHISPSFSLMILVLFLCTTLQGIYEIKRVKEYMYSCFYISNIYFKYEHEDYFLMANPSKLLHTWSLSIEMQFYMLFSVFISIFRKNEMFSNIILITITIISFIYEVCYVYIGERSVYYSLFSRLWEFTIGMIVAINKLKYTKKVNTDILVLILITIPFINFKINLSVLRAIEIMICLFILENDNIYQDENSEVKERRKSSSIILNNTILKHIGKMSYTLYLIHYPILLTKYSLLVKVIIIYILSFVLNKIVELLFYSIKVTNKQKSIIIMLLYFLPITPVIIIYFKLTLLSSYLRMDSSNIDFNEKGYNNIDLSETATTNISSQYKSIPLKLHSFDKPIDYSKIEYLDDNMLLFKTFEDSYYKTNIDEDSEVWLRKPIAYVIGDSYCMQWMGVIKKYCSERNITLIYSQIIVRDFIKNTAKELLKDVILEDMIVKKNIHFDIIFVAFALNMKKKIDIKDQLDVQYPILINSLSKYGDEIISFEGTPMCHYNGNYYFSSCTICVLYKRKYCYAVLGMNISYSEHFKPIHLRNYHVLDFYEKQFCYNNLCSCVINNSFVYESHGHINPDVLKLFQNEFDEHVDNILNSKFKKIKEYDSKDKKNLFVSGYLIHSQFMSFFMRD